MDENPYASLHTLPPETASSELRWDKILAAFILFWLIGAGALGSCFALFEGAIAQQRLGLVFVVYMFSGFPIGAAYVASTDHRRGQRLKLWLVGTAGICLHLLLHGIAAVIASTLIPW
jgi:hypothetical protein